MRLRRDDACASCHAALPRGTEAYWLAAEGHVLCRSCGDEAPASGSRAGTSADREYERRRQARIERQRDRFGRIGGWAAELSTGPLHEQAWARGADGERRNAIRLEKLVARQPVIFLHDRRVPGSRANIDHIAIAPAGVFVIDSKNAKGAVKIDWAGGLFSERRWFLKVAGRDRTSWVEGVERQVEVVRTALAAAGFAETPLRGALCMANGEGLPWIGHPRLREVAICRPRHVAKWLRADGPMPLETVRAVHTALDRALPPA